MVNKLQILIKKNNDKTLLIKRNNIVKAGNNGYLKKVWFVKWKPGEASKKPML